MLTKNTLKYVTRLAAMGVACVLATSCGSSSSGNAISANVGLNNLPSADSMAAANGSASGIRRSINTESSGTPTAFLTIADSAALTNTDIFGGLIGTSISSMDQVREFFGQNPGGPGGIPACYTLQGIAGSFGNLLQNSNTTCYLKHIASTTSSGITVTGADQATMFEQQADDRLMQMLVKNADAGNNTKMNMDVDVTLSGTNTVGSDVYKIQLDFCDTTGTDTPMQEEVITINRSTGAFTDDVVGGMGGNGGASTLAATLKAGSGGDLAFDATADRSATFYWSQDANNVGQGKIVLHGNNTMELWQYNTFSQGGSSGTNKNYAAAIFSGDSLANLLISDASVNSWNSNTWSGQPTRTNAFTGNTAWVDTQYTAGSASSTVTDLTSAETVTSDAFFTANTPTTTVTSGFSCNSFTAKATVTGTMDFDVSDVGAIQTTCDGNQISSTVWDMCNSTAIQSEQNAAQTYMWTNNSGNFN